MPPRRRRATLIDSIRRGSTPAATPLQAASQHAALRASLVTALGEHTTQLAQQQDVARTLTAGSSETVSSELATAMSLAAGLRDAIDEINAALDRIDRGTYGICESCGNAIPTARLEAITHTRLCVSCPRQRSPIRAARP